MKHRKISGIYAIINWSENTTYVGSSVDVRSRLVGHRGRLQIGKHHSRALQSDWNRIGESGFAFLFLEEADLTLLQEREAFWINALGGRKKYNSCAAHQRRDLRFKRLQSCRTMAGTVWVGQPVLMSGRVWDIDGIFQNRGMAAVELSCGEQRHTEYGLNYNLGFLPMECE